VWVASSATCLSTLTGHRYVPFPCIECFLSYFGTDLVFLTSQMVTSVAYSPCGKWIASGSCDETVRIWDAATGAPVGSPLSGHSSYVRSVCFSPDGKQIASGSEDKTVKIWNASTGELQSTLTGHNAPVTQVEFIDADTVVSSSGLDGTTRAWDIATGTQKAEFEGDKFTFTKSRDGKRTASPYVVTKKGDLVLVHLTHALKNNEPTAEAKQAVAFFRAPGVVEALECAGDRIAVGCKNGQVLHLQAPWLVDS
jgi:WD40 repeat protein